MAFAASMLLIVVLVCALSAVSAIQGEIVSCPGCKLNKLPEVRTFFKGDGHANSYENLKITFIHGRNPDLIIKNDNGDAIDRIDLSRMRNAEIHALMATKGFVRKPGSPELTLDPVAAAAAVLRNVNADAGAEGVTKVGTMRAGMPHMNRGGSGGRLRKRQESLMKSLTAATSPDAVAAIDAPLETHE